MTLPNLIIAGTVKSGTTSLFSYLVSHPDFCGSKVKETCFFLPARYGGNVEDFKLYESYFSHCGCEKYVLESTPGYLDGGRRVADAIKSAGVDAKIIIILRSPVDRLFSFYRYQKAQLGLKKTLRFSEYLQCCSDMPLEQRSAQQNDAYWGVNGGFYIRYLSEWYEVFEESDIKILFFDDLKSNPGSVMSDLSAWLAVDEKLFGSDGYLTENKTIPYRFALLHKVAIVANRRFESFLRRRPALKKFVRWVYYKLNSDVESESLSEADRDVAVRLYEDDNKRLSVFLAGRGYTNQPRWLKGGT